VQIGQKELAIADFKKALELFPEYKRAKDELKKLGVPGY
jgi:hypothetical protein